MTRKDKWKCLSFENSLAHMRMSLLFLDMIILNPNLAISLQIWSFGGYRQLM